MAQFNLAKKQKIRSVNSYRPQNRPQLNHHIPQRSTQLNRESLHQRETNEHRKDNSIKDSTYIIKLAIIQF